MEIFWDVSGRVVRVIEMALQANDIEIMVPISINHGQPPSNLLCISNQPWRLVLFEHIMDLYYWKMSFQETHQNHSEPLITVTGELWRSARQSHPMRPSKPNTPDPDPFRNWSGRGVSGRAKNTHPTHKTIKLNHIAWAACPARNTPKNIT